MAPSPAITVVVCTFRRYDLLHGCLASVLEQTIDAARREILVVDNSGPGAGGEAFDWPSSVRRIEAARAGLSQARNLGVAAARGGVIAFIDDDARAGPGWLDAILSAFGEAPSAAVAGGPVVPVWPSARPQWVDGWHDGFLSIVDRGDQARSLEAGEWLAGTNIAFRAEILRDLGPFPEHLGRLPEALLGNEEIAVLARIRAAGHAIRYDPRIEVRHHIHANRLTQAWMRRRVAWQAVSDMLLDTPPADAGMRALWRTVSAYLEMLPPAYRGFVGLLRDENDPATSRAQSEAIMAMVRILTQHGTSLESSLRDSG